MGAHGFIRLSLRLKNLTDLADYFVAVIPPDKETVATTGGSGSCRFFQRVLSSPGNDLIPKITQYQLESRRGASGQRGEAEEDL